MQEDVVKLLFNTLNAIFITSLDALIIVHVGYLNLIRQWHLRSRNLKRKAAARDLFEKAPTTLSAALHKQVLILDCVLDALLQAETMTALPWALAPEG